MTILDYGLLAFLVVTLAIGLKNGFAKMISTTVCVIVALAASVVVTIELLRLINDTEIFGGLQGLATSWFKKPIMTTEVASQEQLVDVLATSGVLSVLKGLAGPIFKVMTRFGLDTLGEFFGFGIALVVVAFVLWLAIYLIFKYILLAIKKLLTKVAKVPVLKSIDKIAGAILSVGLGYIIVFGVLYSASAVICAKFIPELGTKVVSMANRSLFFSYVHHTNILGQAICQFFNVNYALFAPIA